MSSFELITSEVAIKYMEEELVKIEQEIAGLLEARQKEIEEKPTDMNIVMAYIK